MKSEYVLIHAAPIKHYGIKGQKRGVRRYQYDDGTLTAAGKLRYLDNGATGYTNSNAGEQTSGRKKNVTGTTEGATTNKNNRGATYNPNPSPNTSSNHNFNSGPKAVSSGQSRHIYKPTDKKTSRYYDMLIQKGKGTLADENKKEFAKYNEMAGVSNKDVKLAVSGINGVKSIRRMNEERAAEARRITDREKWISNENGVGYVQNDEIKEKKKSTATTSPSKTITRTQPIEEEAKRAVGSAVSDGRGQAKAVSNAAKRVQGAVSIGNHNVDKYGGQVPKDTAKKKTADAIDLGLQKLQKFDNGSTLIRKKKKGGK